MNNKVANEQYVLVCSDTHVSDAAKLPNTLLQLAERANFIVHAGDLVALDVVDVLGSFAPVTAVYGNCDGFDAIEKLTESATAKLSETSWGVIHDAGAKTGRHSRLVAQFPHAQAIVYGHSHMPEITQLDTGQWILNPGSPTQKRRAEFHSAIWVTIHESQIVTAELINLDA